MRALVFMLALGLCACAPSDPAARLAQQWQVCEAGLIHDQRIAACSAVIADDATAPDRRAAALIQRGMLRAELVQHTRAVADFGRALRIDPSLVQAYVARAAVHQERGAFDRAVRDYDAALALNPRSSAAVEGREAALSLRTSSYGLQIQRLTEALAEAPGDVSLLNNRCWVRAISDDDLDAALADCDAALRIEPAHAATLDSRGMVRLKRGEFDLALADYEAALAVEPGRGHYLYGRGIARIRLGQEDEGWADLEAAEAAEPGITRVYAGYGVHARVEPDPVAPK